jgi:hypothetical protein
MSAVRQKNLDLPSESEANRGWIYVKREKRVRTKLFVVREALGLKSSVEADIIYLIRRYLGRPKIRAVAQGRSTNPERITVPARPKKPGGRPSASTHPRNTVLSLHETFVVHKGRNPYMNVCRYNNHSWNCDRTVCQTDNHETESLDSRNSLLTKTRRS